MKEFVMQDIYRVTVCGRTLESRNLKQLLSRAVSEKRNMDRRLRLFSGLERNMPGGSSLLTGNTGAHAAGLI
jgi:hypothetical protein